MSFRRTIYKDIALDADGDLRIVNGDFVLEESDQMHIEHIVESDKGNWRETPLQGVGIVRFLNSDHTIKNKGQLVRKIRLQLAYDNLEILKLEILKNSQISIEAKRTK